MEQHGTFDHKVDKALVPVCPILGVKLAAIDMPWLLSFTQEHLKELSGDYICVSNVHTTVTAYEDPSYMEVQNGGILAIPDGGTPMLNRAQAGLRPDAAGHRPGLYEKMSGIGPG